MQHDGHFRNRLNVNCSFFGNWGSPFLLDLCSSFQKTAKTPVADTAHAMMSRLLTLHLYRGLIPLSVRYNSATSLYLCQDYVCCSDHRQLYSLRQTTANKSSWTQTNHNTLNNKLLFKYTRLSLVLADILNVSFSPSYGLEIIIPLSLKWCTKRETYSDIQGGNSELEYGPKAGVMCKV